MQATACIIINLHILRIVNTDMRVRENLGLRLHSAVAKLSSSAFFGFHQNLSLTLLILISHSNLVAIVIDYTPCRMTVFPEEALAYDPTWK